MNNASDDVRAAADYDRDTAVFIRGAFEAERRGNIPRELISLVLTKAIPCRSPLLWSQGVVGGWCNFWCFWPQYRVKVSEVMLEY
jgi:hypothetical protein